MERLLILTKKILHYMELVKKELNYASKFSESTEISSRLRQMIKESGITQREFCDTIGISTGHLSKVLTNRAIPSGAMLIAIANSGYDVQWILSGDSGKMQLQERDLEIEKLKFIVKELKSLINYNMKN